MLFDPKFSDPPFLTVPPLLSPDKTYQVETLCTCSIWCLLLDRFFLLRRVHVISTGPISTAQTERSGVLHPPRAE
ncbi:unnamed protein product [Staurois parvus]|uniref:Uncharacterized protein n=1 Tax=Staurois parvus TaxID=386267 RepID=A0ABN9BDF1_9NEOB|nr:unnamed protein product [Staurois parvus]